MNLLFLTSRIPYPPNRGDKVRTFFFLKELSKLHKVTLVSMVESKTELQYKKELDKYCSNVYLFFRNRLQHLLKFASGFFNKLPFQVNYYNFPFLRRQVKQIVEKENIDLIYVHLIRMAPIVKNINVKKILDYTDAISMEYTRSLPHRTNPVSKLFFTMEAQRTRKYEKQIIDHFDEGWFISSEDIMNLKLEKNPKVKIVPNPVVIKECKKNYSETGRIIFVGNMSVAHNVAAVKFVTNEIMPELLKIRNIQFHIIGANPVNEVMALDKKNNTKVLGFVSDLYKELSDSDIFIAPMFFSAGIQNKVLEAMAVGLPVLTTANVVKSIMASDKVNIVVCESKNDFVIAIQDLLENKTKRESIGKSGYLHMKSTFSIEVISKVLEENTK